MRQQQRLSGIQVAWWTVVGLGSGLVAGFALSEWVGGVSRSRVRRAAARLGRPEPILLTPAAAARAVEEALREDSQLTALALRASAAGRGTVQLHGWVPSRAARARAGRLALGVPGVDRVVNSLLVRGEDDHLIADSEQATDQSA